MKPLLSCLLLISLAAAAAGQTVYKWVDEDGETHYSQTLPPEQVERGHERLTGDGLLAERIERAPTAAERAELQARLEAERDVARQQQLRAQQDRLFLAAFPTEQDVRRAIESRRDTVENERRTVESLIEQNRANFNQLVLEAAGYERRGEPVPDHLARRIQEARTGLAELNGRLEAIDERLDSLDQQLAADLELHLRLTGSG